MSKLKVKLIPGKEYLFTHKRRHTFRALYKGIERAPATDAEDEYYFKCEIGTHQPSGEGRVMNIRPSLITIVQDVPQYDPPAHRVGSGLRPSIDTHSGEEGVLRYYRQFKSFFRGLRK